NSMKPVKMPNATVTVSEFVLLCTIEKDQMTLTIVTLAVIYLVMLVGNLLVIVVNPPLYSPMSFYIATLAVVDVVNNSNLIPRMLANLLFNSSTVAYGLCLLQLSVVHHLGLVEGLLLSIMACDRYVAIVYPLRYPSIITNLTVCFSILLVNVIAAAILTPNMVFTAELSFCHTNCFGDFVTILQVSFSEDPRHLILLSSTTTATGVGELAVILFSCVRIVKAALKICSANGKKKAFSTLLTHLLVVCLFNLPLMISYVVPGVGISAEAYNVLVIIAILVPPMLNPIIYSFRNKEIKSILYRMWAGKRVNPDSH
uniref:Olfactory receptor n=1 Tax=Erpetoichthys calabaricus TaxID=27687 RepID=A0A8C4XD45_ERPCA